ncbi:DNA replication complex GINS family protein [Methanosarcina sp. MSH10X1]|uniref:DNA replication complex GINS family protein n=1 Tax=Methanosarcina sp. MSH10X1 TaxID=2507075 RepID=UPI000FFC9028|nr:DNA replication complex GINS family protein [Methanosarcina sp. MSH10X1]RXA20541.1 DNA replication complex GINS family protein [Methanosarcina sp. MSH10X1]
MDIEEISQVLYKEKNQTLKTIPADFYLEAEKYIRDLEKEIGKVNNSRSPESKMLHDEHERALSDLETIFMKRIGKVITRATIQSHADKPISKDIEKLLPAEKRLYDLVLKGIEAAKTELLGPILYPDSENIPVWPGIGVEKQAIPEGMRGETEARIGIPSVVARGETGSKPDKNNINDEYVVVRILKDLPTFTGADGRNYTVSAEEVVVLPQLNATGLVKRNAAKLIAGQENSGKNLFPGKN